PGAPLLFFFQAEDGIRDFHVTGVQTCALPISSWALACPACPSAPLAWKTPTRRPKRTTYLRLTTRVKRPFTPLTLSFSPVQQLRSEERRVGKECRSRWTSSHGK